VKSPKYHFYCVVGNSTLSFNELRTLIFQVSAMLNSRLFYLGKGKSNDRRTPFNPPIRRSPQSLTKVVPSPESVLKEVEFILLVPALRAWEVTDDPNKSVTRNYGRDRREQCTAAQMAPWQSKEL